MSEQDVNNNENNEQSTDSGKTVDHRPGIAGTMARAFIQSPLSPLLLFACLVVGILGLMMTPRQEDPQISVPMVDIFVHYPGASSQQVAALVADPLERLMSEIKGVKHVYSASQRGRAMITVRFEVGEKMGASLIKVYDKLASNMDMVPPGASEPLVKPKGIDDVPIVTVTLWSEQVDDNMLRNIAREIMQHAKNVPDTGQSFLVGGRATQVRVEVDPARLSGYGIPLDRIANAIRMANSERKAGNYEIGGKTFTVYTGSFLKSANDVSNIVVAVQKGQPVYLRDVARVWLAPQETSHMVRYISGVASKEKNKTRGAEAVTFAIAKKEGSNGVSVARNIISMINGLKGRKIPDNVNVSITRNYGHTADQKVNELMFKLLVATVAVTLLVWFTLGARAAAVVLVVIPIVILLTVWAAWLMGYSINRVSLFALIFAIGILVDDAIVVVENIFRRWLQKGDTDRVTAIDAVREVGNPTILATFTVIAALLPMGFVRDMMGPYMEPIPALGTIAMLVSLGASFIFAPWLAMKMKPSLSALHVAERLEQEKTDKRSKLYRKLMTPLMTRRKIGWAVMGGILAAWILSCALLYFKMVTVKMLPYDNKSEFNVVINMPAGSALPDTANLTRKLADFLRLVPEVTALQTYVGTASPFNFNGMVRHYYLRKNTWQADIQVQLTAKKNRKRSSHEIAESVRKLLTPVVKKAGARISVVEMPPGPPVLAPIVAEVYGPDDRTRRKFASDLTRIFRSANVLVDVDNYMQAKHKVVHFIVNVEKASRQNISVAQINRNLAMAMGGFSLGDIKHGSLEPTHIILQVPHAQRAILSRLAALPIQNRRGQIVPLGELGRFVFVDEDPVIYHKDLRPVEYVVGNVQGRLGAPIYGMMQIDRLLQNYLTPDGFKVSGEYLGPPADNNRSGFEWTGEWTVTYITFRDMGLAFAVALLLIYILVVWEFGNFILPVIIMAPIPLTLIGILPGHWIMGAEFTATSMIGFIALAGIIVRNSILLVDFAQQEVARGVDVRVALTLAAQTRLRPIVLTALALVAGSSVILFDPIFQGMAISLMFGVMVATLLTLIVIPLGCYSARTAFCPASVAPASGSDITETDTSRARAFIERTTGASFEKVLKKDDDNKEDS